MHETLGSIPVAKEVNIQEDVARLYLNIIQFSY
jgi:hypothetical protein